MTRRPWRRADSTTEFSTLAPLYWYLGPAMGLLPIALMVLMFAVIGSSRANGDITWPLAGFIAAVVLGAAGLFTGSKVTLAEGGVWIRHYKGLFKRFVPYADIAVVDKIDRLGKQGRTKLGNELNYIIFHAVRLTLKNGKRVVFCASSEEVEPDRRQNYFMGQYGDFGGSDPVARQIVNAIRDRIRTEEDLPEPTPAEAALMRGDRSVEEWHAALAQNSPAAGDAYRGDAATEGLWRIVEDEDAPRDARAGAAVALKAQLDDDGRTRLRVVAEGCEPKLRIALDAALDDDAKENEVIAALERASDRRE